MVDLMSLVPNFNIGTIGLVLLIFFGAVVLVGCVGGIVWWKISKKQLRHILPIYKRVGNRTIRIGTYKAKDFKIGMAGDKLWYIPKLKKYISPATLQTAPNEYSHFERTDGEWINIDFPDIDAKFQKLNVKYIDQDMRSQRIAISEILEQRFKGKQSWWDKYGNMITYVIVYLVIAISMVVIFYQFSAVVEKIGVVLDRVIAYEEKSKGIVPALIPLILWRFKNGWNS